jgi:hypothetical protein
MAWLGARLRAGTRPRVTVTAAIGAALGAVCGLVVLSGFAPPWWPVVGATAVMSVVFAAAYSYLVARTPIQTEK